MVGTDRLRLWASLLMLARIEEKPVELFVTAIVRARMCEQLAFAHHIREVDQYFTVGLFSILDGLLDQPMSDIVRTLPLEKEIRQALLNRQGSLGMTLDCVLAYERGDWDTIEMATCGVDSRKDVAGTGVALRGQNPAKAHLPCLP